LSRESAQGYIPNEQGALGHVWSMNNVKQLNLVFHLYANDNDDRIVFDQSRIEQIEVVKGSPIKIRGHT
jgi:hypothetical protein